MPQQRPKVVIVGAGFGGLEAAKALSRVTVDVTVIDRQNHHCFQPLLYQVATAALSPAEIAWPIRHMLRQQRNATVFMAEVEAIDLAARFVQTGAGPFSYDYLVLATGATHSYFGHDEWAEFAPGLKRIEDATRIRRSILLAFERAELAGDDTERQRLLTPARRWPRTFAGSTRAVRASFCSRRVRASCRPCPRIFRAMQSARSPAWAWM